MFRRFLRKSDGSAALEFSLMLPVFLLILFAIIEVGYLYYAKNMLASGLKKASLVIRTGAIEAVPEAERESEFRRRICGAVVLFDCSNRLVINVRNAVDFGTVSSALEGTNLTEADLGFEPGAALSIVMAEAIYDVPTVLITFTPDFFADENGDITASARTYFRNEPF